MSDFIAYNQSLVSYSEKSGSNTNNPKSGAETTNTDITEGQQELNGDVNFNIPQNEESGDNEVNVTDASEEVAKYSGRSFEPKDLFPIDAEYKEEGEWTDINIDDLRSQDNINRLRTETPRTLKIFLYNLVPYFVRSAISTATGLVSDVAGITTPTSFSDFAGGAMKGINAVSGAINFAKMLMYFTPAEMALYAITSAVTLSLYKEFTIKRYRTNIVKGKLVEEFDTDPVKNLEFGKDEVNESFFDILARGPRAWIAKLIQNLQSSSHANGGTAFEEFRREHPGWTDYLSVLHAGTNIAADSESTHYLLTGQNPDINPYDDFKMNIPSLETVDEGLHSFENFRDPKSQYIKDAYITLYSANRNASFQIWNVSEESKSFSLNIKNIENNTAINLDTLKNYYNDNYENIEEKGYGRDILRNLRPDVSSLGYVRVIPIESVSDTPYKIPFEFNPVISEMSYAASYEAINMLGRVGEIQSYIRTSGTNLTLTTQYYATADNEGTINPDTYGHDWIKFFNLSAIQTIESAYKSLIYPSFSREEQETSTGYFYFKPPIIKVVIGGVELPTEVNGNGPYANLLTYPFYLRNDDQVKIYHKTFIVSNININKNMEELPLYINDNKQLIDTFGFSISIQLLEIDPSYINVQPSYNDYYQMSNKMVTNQEIRRYLAE